jgi:phenylalanyl-tRNA synthetase beta chain
MLEILSKNYNNRNASVKLFEVGNEYIPTEDGKLPNEPKRLAIGMYGGCDFFDLKGIVEVLLDRIGIQNVEYVRPSEGCPFDEVSAFHPTRTAVVKSGDVAIGILGEVHPTVTAEYGIDTKVYVAKFLLPEMMEIAVTEKNYKPLPKFPASTRDISLVCDKSLPSGDIQKTIQEAVGKTLETVTLFDIFTDESKLGEGKKSLSYSIVMRSAEGTLTDEQVDASMKRVLKALSKIGAELRA